MAVNLWPVIFPRNAHLGHRRKFVSVKKKHPKKCAVPDCTNAADHTAYLNDDHPRTGKFYERYWRSSPDDPSDAFLCDFHMEENEWLAEGPRRAGKRMTYPYTPLLTTGWITYEPLRTKRARNTQEDDEN